MKPIPQQGAPNWRNRKMFCGDNLKFLQGMNSRSVHLIIARPPLDANSDARADSSAAAHDLWSWNSDVHGGWVDHLQDDWPRVMRVIKGFKDVYGDKPGAFLCYMAVRLIAMHRVLRDDGSLYLHCNSNKYWFKPLMDALFGQKNVLNEVVWCDTNRGRSPRGKRYQWAERYNTFLWYAKKRSAFRADCVVPCTSEYIAAAYRQKDSRGQACRISKDAEGNERIFYPTEGMHGSDWWADIPHISGKSAEVPAALYERIIKTSTSEGDVVLDPFCRSGSSLVAAEKLKRCWTGIDLQKEAYEALSKKLESEGLPRSTRTSRIPERTDDGGVAVQFLEATQQLNEPKGPKMSHKKMLETLVEQHGCRCQGCGRSFDSPRYLELDHNTPRADGGLNHISNRVLLCGPCNRAKGHTLTLSGLRQLNAKNGWMTEEN